MNFKPGDLVMVVKPTECCNNQGSIGKILTVLSKQPTPQKICVWCQKVIPTKFGVCLSDGHTRESERLRLIPPLSDDTEITRELEAA